MTPPQRASFHFRQLCRRLLDIDPVCNDDKGCPAVFVAWPMVREWKPIDLPWPKSVQRTISQLMTAEYSSFGCEIHLIRSYAEEFLKEEDDSE